MSRHQPRRRQPARNIRSTALALLAIIVLLITILPANTALAGG